MAWPANDLTTIYLSSDSSSILLARPEIYNTVIAVRSIIDSRGAPSGVASLDVAGYVPVAELPPTHKSFGSVHLTLESGTGKVIIKDFIELTPFTQAQLDAKTNLKIGDLAICSDGDGGEPGISIYDGTQWKSTVSTTTIGPKQQVYDVDITSNAEVFFTIPSNVTRLKITAIGGGGGGGSAISDDGSTVAIGGNGGAGAQVVATLDNLTTGDTVSILVGVGGSGGFYTSDDGTENGQDGEETLITITRTDSSVQVISALGGTGGSVSTGGVGTHGVGGVGAVTNITTGKFYIVNGNDATNVASGAGSYGKYVVTRSDEGPGTTAGKFGSGGNAGYDSDSTGYNGGAGSSGLVIVEY